MEISSKRRLILFIFIFLVLIFGFLSLYSINKKPSISKINPIYSANVAESKNLLVPVNFPFPQNIIPNQEFQRSIDGYLEYTQIWESGFSKSENQKIFEDYMKNDGWNPMVMNMGSESVSISGEKGNITLNIFIGKNPSNLKNEVQVHFSQNKK